jgi:hypothetical protein
MAKLAFFASIATIIAALGFASMSAADDAAVPCKHTTFKTQLAKDACTAGYKDKKGQAAAKAAMQDFMKTAKIDGKTPSCSTKFCHKNLAPNYDLKDDAFDQFKKTGGKMLDDAKPATK